MLTVIPSSFFTLLLISSAIFLPSPFSEKLSVTSSQASSRTVLRGGKDSNALLLPDYASVEMLYHPEYVGKPLAVGGDSEARHGIVLTANYIAKRSGVKTGMALWQAKQVCPDLIFVPPRMDLYLKFSSMLREIYSEYTNQVEPYGCDEAWLTNIFWMIKHFHTSIVG